VFANKIKVRELYFLLLRPFSQSSPLRLKEATTGLAHDLIGSKGLGSGFRTQ
jgi:hypothetical protein